MGFGAMKGRAALIRGADTRAQPMVFIGRRASLGAIPFRGHARQDHGQPHHDARRHLAGPTTPARPRGLGARRCGHRAQRSGA
jgi:hypothetical protein